MASFYLEIKIAISNTGTISYDECNTSLQQPGDREDRAYSSLDRGAKILLSSALGRITQGT